MRTRHLNAPRSGFALPTVMIASIVMLVVLLSGLVATSSVNVSLREQYSQKQLSNASDAGMAMANACLRANNFEITWNESQPLKPNTNCLGDEFVSCPTTSTDARCYVMDTGSARTSFRVDTTASSDSISVEASVMSIRPTTGSVSNIRKQEIMGARASTKLAGVSASGSYACAVAADTKAYCWGSNGYGTLANGTTSGTANSTPTMIQQGAIPTNTQIQSIATTFTHACVIASNSRAYCWGTNTLGQLGNNSTAAAYSPVAVSQGAMPSGMSLRVISGGYYHTCAIGYNTKVYCWGDNSQGQLGNGGVGASSAVPVEVAQGAMPVGVYATALASSYNHTCAVASNNKVYCWGRNIEGQLGNGSTTNATSPVAVSDGAMVGTAASSAITTGYNHTCVLGVNGKSYCWGLNTSNQLGNGNATNSTIPVLTVAGAVPADVSLKQIASHYLYTCAVGSNNTVYCWGPNQYGQFGNNTTTASSTPVATSSGVFPAGSLVTGITVGDYHTCVNGSNAKLYCWGYNGFGQLGNGNTTQQNTPIESAGNSIGQLGNGNTTNSSTPVAVSQGAIPAGVTTLSLSGGGGTVCMLGVNYKVYCWGGNDAGQLGNGNTTNSSTPVAVQQGSIPADVIVRSFSVGGGLGTNACVVGTNNKAYCWGGNSRGQLGNGNTTPSTTPVAVSQGAIPVGVTIRSISTSGETTCAVASDDKAYCWGRNDWGQLGNGNTTGSSTPVSVAQGSIPAGVTLRSISVGSATCAVGSDSKTYCWGYNANGTLGNGTTTASNVPVTVSQGAIPGGITVKNLSLTGGTACVIGSDLKAYCWGTNDTGQVGDAGYTNATTPRAVVAGTIPAGVTIRSIRTGSGHTCATGSNSRLYCWGDNGWGQLGYGTFDTGSASPAQPTQGLRWAASVTVDSLIRRY